MAILIIDDNKVSANTLSRILSEEYDILEAKTKKGTLKMLSRHSDEIIAVILRCNSSALDAYDILKLIFSNPHFHNLPIIMTGNNRDCNDEDKALSLGAWDFIYEPYSENSIKLRVKNAIDRSQFTAFRDLKYLAEFDILTGIFNKSKFFDATREMINQNQDVPFAFLRFDVDRFQLINSFFGTQEGDRLLVYIADRMQDYAESFKKITYGRIESDVFGFCLPYDETILENMIKQSKRILAKYNANYDIVSSVGVYIIDDNTISVEEMYNRATLAAKTCKGNYMQYYAYYDESMSSKLANEQLIVNEMNSALENNQFEIYLQPKYNIHNNLPCGAEALVRWRHPQKGMLSPANLFQYLNAMDSFPNLIFMYGNVFVFVFIIGFRKELSHTPYPSMFHV